MKTLLRVIATTFALALPLTGCSNDTVDLDISATLPSNVESVSSGVLRLSLWVYDPLLADAPATLADEDSARFSHTKGETNRFRFHVKSNVMGGHRYYITLRGFELTADCERYILWDGIEDLGTPRDITLKPVPVPSCQR